MCRFKLTTPSFKAWMFSWPKSDFAKPPLYFKARIVATRTTQSGFKPPTGHLISRNFSAPRSAPKPASVTVMSASFKAVFIAIKVLQPWTILENGPP